MITRIEDQLHSQDVDIELTDAAKTLLAKTGYDPALGARPLRRAIQRHVEDPLSEKILWKEFEAGDTIVVDVERNEHGDEVIGFRKGPRAPDVPPLEMAGTAPEEGSTDGDTDIAN
jgi:ATP-dependent Clp protease ATP-binding subunit ClpC